MYIISDGRGYIQIMYSHDNLVLICTEKAGVIYSGLNEAYQHKMRFFRIASSVERIDIALHDPGVVCSNSCLKRVNRTN